MQFKWLFYSALKQPFFPKLAGNSRPSHISFKRMLVKMKYCFIAFHWCLLFEKKKKKRDAAMSILNAFGRCAIPISSAIIPVGRAAVLLLNCLGRLTYMQYILLPLEKKKITEADFC